MTPDNHQPPKVSALGVIKRVRQHHHFISAGLDEIIASVEVTLELDGVSLHDFLRIARAYLHEHRVEATLSFPQAELPLETVLTFTTTPQGGFQP
jgi:hypothetical protein